MFDGMNSPVRESELLIKRKIIARKMMWTFTV